MIIRSEVYLDVAGQLQVLFLDVTDQKATIAITSIETISDVDAYYDDANDYLQSASASWQALEKYDKYDKALVNDDYDANHLYLCKNKKVTECDAVDVVVINSISSPGLTYAELHSMFVRGGSYA